MAGKNCLWKEANGNITKIRHQLSYVYTLLQRFKVGQLFNGTTVSNPLLMNHTTNRNHGKAAVHDLIDLVLLEDGGILAKTQWIESEVTWFALTFQSLLESVAADALKRGDEQKNLRHAASLDVVIVGVNWKHLREVGITKGEQLLNNHAEGGEHANPSVLDLSGAEETDIDVIRDEKGVEFNRAWQTIKILGLEKEGHALAHLHGDGRRRPLCRGCGRGEGGADEGAGTDGESRRDETNHCNRERRMLLGEGIGDGRVWVVA